MAAQKGSALLMKIGDGASPEVFTTIGGLRSTSISLNEEAVDVTTKDSSGKYRELLGAASSLDCSSLLLCNSSFSFSFVEVVFDRSTVLVV